MPHRKGSLPASRREFITLLGGAAAAWPLDARAQQDGRVRRVGVLMGFSAGDPEAAARIAALMAGLRDFGWTEGRNFRLELSWGVDTVERTQEAAAKLVATNPDIILATTTPHAQELQRQTRTIPVVFVNLSDPLDSGVVASLARPGGNTTGFMSLELTVAGKWVEALKEIVPSIRRVLALANVGNAGNLGYLRLVDASASTLGIEVVSASVRDASETERAIASISGDPHAGLIVLPGPPIQDHRQLIFALAARGRLPAIYAFRFFTAEGGAHVLRVGRPRHLATVC
jgi:putative tryptophan/tyrosine transport system substrate-binding protein